MHAAKIEQKIRTAKRFGEKVANNPNIRAYEDYRTCKTMKTLSVTFIPQYLQSQYQ